MKRGLLLLVLATFAGPARGQSFEISPLVGGGYTTGSELDRTALGIGGLKVKGGFTWGGQLGYFFGPHLGVEASWAQQQTALALETASGSAELFEMSRGQLHGSLVYQLGGEEARVRPYVLAGLGAAFLSASELQSETRFSWGAGGGVKLFFSKAVGVRLQAKYTPTRLDDEDAAPFCDPFGFCSDALRQAEFMGGLVLRF